MIMYIITKPTKVMYYEILKPYGMTLTVSFKLTAEA